MSELLYLGDDFSISRINYRQIGKNGFKNIIMNFRETFNCQSFQSCFKLFQEPMIYLKVPKGQVHFVIHSISKNMHNNILIPTYIVQIAFSVYWKLRNSTEKLEIGKIYKFLGIFMIIRICFLINVSDF